MESQSAAECAFQLHPLVKDRIDSIERINIRTHKKMLGVMDKRGPLTNPADRDHCAQYVVAVALLHGRLEPTDFEDAFAADPRIDRLREKMTIEEEPRYTRDRVDPAKRSNGNSVQVHFSDGSVSPRVEVEYPIGHARRRSELLPRLEAKFDTFIRSRFSQRRCAAIRELCFDVQRLESTPVHEMMDLFVI
jgi:2-methylcitrate dehydratase